MKIKLSRTAAPDRSSRRIPLAKPQELFAELEMDPENVRLLLNLQPQQLAAAHLNEGQDRCYVVKWPLIFHTMVTSQARPHRNRRERNNQLVEILDLMKDHLTDYWKLEWSTLEDLALEGLEETS